ncbi:MAG: hypothetical protein ACOYXN_04005 [Acidobacteriota bacterium]
MGRAKRRGTRAGLFSVAVWIAALSSALWAGPVITDVQVSEITDTTATVTWTTNEAADSRVDFGPTRALGSYVEVEEAGTSHSITLTDLPCDTYLFSVTSSNQDGTTTEDDGGQYHLFTLDCARLEVASHWWMDSCDSSPGDGLAGPGETLDLTLRILNRGGTDATAAQVAVSTSTSGVTVTPSSVSLDTVEAYDTTLFFQPEDASFTVDIGRDVPCGARMSFTVTMTCEQGSWQETFVIPVGSPAAYLLEEDFSEDDPPTGWSLEDGGDAGQTWTTANPAERPLPEGMSGYVEILDSDHYGEGGIQEDSLVSPSLDCTDAVSVDLTFRSFLWAFQTGHEESAFVDVSTDGGTTWQTVETWRVSVGNPPAGGFPPEADPGESVPVVLDLSDLAAGHSDVRVRFRYLGHYGYYWMVDDVKVAAWESGGSCSATPCCDVPSGLSAPSVTDENGICADDGARITWAAAPTAWGDEGLSSPDRGYRVFRGATDASGYIAYGATSWVDTGGTNNTAYDYSVKYINTCGEEASTSTVSGTDAYQPATPTITGDSTNTCPATTVALSTESGMSSYQWRKNGNPVGTNSAAYTATESGTYTVSYTNGSGCSGTSAGHAVTIQTCSVAPAPDGRGGTSPARGVKSGSDITVTFDSTTCPAPSYNLYYGPLSSVSTYGWTGSVCGITSGSSWTPPSGNTFWIIVGDSGPMESSWGLKRVGGVESQRSTSASGLCGNSLIDTTSTCP